MSKLKKALKAALTPNISKVEKLAEEHGGYLTLNGLEYVEGLYGRTAVFTTVEGGKFWASGSAFVNQIIPAMYAECGSLDAINAELVAEPIVIRVGEMVKLKNGYNYRVIEVM